MYLCHTILKQTTMARSKRAKIKSGHNIIIINPEPNTYASAILLRRSLKKLDDRFEEARKYLGMRWEFLNKRLESEGDLVCAYCGRKHLDVGLEDLESSENNRINTQNKNLATIDHFFPVKDHPLFYLETRNWLVSCRKCNGKKSSKNPFKWLRMTKTLFHIPTGLEELINSHKHLLSMKNHEKTGYRHPDEYKHIKKMIELHKNVA